MTDTRWLAELRPTADEDEYIAQQYALVERLGDTPNAAVVPLVFEHFERYPDAEHGTPGPLVHLVERFDSVCCDELVASVKRKPTAHTVWMINRRINGSSDRRAEFMGLLESVGTHPLAGEDARSNATWFLEYQRGQST